MGNKQTVAEERTTIDPTLQPILRRMSEICDATHLAAHAILNQDVAARALPRSHTDSFPATSPSPSTPAAHPHIIRLNVGGSVYMTSLTTLMSRPDSMLAAMFAGNFAQPPLDGTGAYFIDRDPTHFGTILNFMRDNEVPLPSDEKTIRLVLKEAEFYQLRDLCAQLRTRLKQVQRDTQRQATKEKEYKMLDDLHWSQLSSQVLNMTRDGYDFESWMSDPTSNRYHVLFSKRLSQGEVAMLDRITSNVY